MKMHGNTAKKLKCMVNMELAVHCHIVNWYKLIYRTNPNFKFYTLCENKEFGEFIKERIHRIWCLKKYMIINTKLVRPSVGINIPEQI